MPKLVVCALLAFHASHCLGHPAYLDCGGLSQAIKAGTQIMGFVPKLVTKPPLDLRKLATTADWTNYSIVTSNPSIAMVIQGTGGTNLTAYNPFNIGSGLNTKCGTQIWASQFSDCSKQPGCIFGVSSHRIDAGQSNVLVGSSDGGGKVLYQELSL